VSIRIFDDAARSQRVNKVATAALIAGRAFHLSLDALANLTG
jgi:hypothetical protein